MKYVDLKKLLYMDSLIQRECTGTPANFARRLELSRTTFFEYLAYLRNEMMLNIHYNGYNETYCYEGANLCSVLGSIRCADCKEKICKDAL